MNFLQLFLIGSNGLLQRGDQLEIFIPRLTISIALLRLVQSNRKQNRGLTKGHCTGRFLILQLQFIDAGFE